MGCDYYIVKVLRVYFNDIEYISIELNRNKGYYYYDFDEDEEDYDKKVIDHINKCLTPQMVPIILYDNNSFKNVLYETKYKLFVQNEIIKYHKKWSDIIKIIKVERRYERN